MSELISPELVHVRVSAPSRDDLLALMATRLQEQGRVKETFLQGLLDREDSYPTGLPINGGVAIPHTDAKHVLEDSVSVATLIHPVGFREMAGVDDTEIPVDVVFMLALEGSEQHLQMLQKVLKFIRDVNLMALVRASRSADEIVKMISKEFASVVS